MCLITKQSALAIADNPITAFKVVALNFEIKKGTDNSSYFTPFTKTKLTCCENGTIKPLVANGKLTKRKNGNYFEIYGNIIHSYKNAYDAFLVANQLRKYNKNTFFFVYECQIPKKTPFYEGKSQTKNGLKAFASKQLIFVKRLQNPYTPKPKQTELEFC